MIIAAAILGWLLCGWVFTRDLEPRKPRLGHLAKRYRTQRADLRAALRRMRSKR